MPSFVLRLQAPTWAAIVVLALGCGEAGESLPGMHAAGSAGTTGGTTSASAGSGGAATCSGAFSAGSPVTTAGTTGAAGTGASAVAGTAGAGGAGAPVGAGNVFGVQGSQVTLNGSPIKVIGLRTSNALVSDTDAQELIDNLDGFKSYGLNTVSVYLMGSRFGDVKGYLPDASLDATYSARLGRIIEAADSRGMIVLVGCLYWSASKAREDLGTWGQAQANQAVANTTRWLKDHDYRNVFVDPDNEGMSDWDIAQMIDASHAVDESIMVAANETNTAPDAADLLIHLSPQVAGKPWIESEGVPSALPYWGSYSKQSSESTGYYNYSRIGRYTPDMKSEVVARSKQHIEQQNGFMLASTWLQCGSGEGIGGPFMSPGGHSAIANVDSDVDVLHPDAGIRWWLEEMQSSYGP